MSDRTLFASLVFAGALILSIVAVPISRWLAFRLGILDHPGERKVHERPTPRIGGVALFVSFLLVVGSGHFLVPLLPGLPEAQSWLATPFLMLQEAPRVREKLIAVLAGATLAFAVGLLDDFLGVRFPISLKAGGQVLAALILIYAGVHTSFLPWHWMNVVVTVLWVVGITNAFNLLDNMDGLSAGVAFIASAVLFVNAWGHDEFFIGLILLAFMGGLFGFLLFNLGASSIFLGDCGSLFVGFVMASLTLLERYATSASSSFFPVLMPVIVLAVPLIDTFTVIVIRVRERRAVWRGDKRHLSHRLVALGFSKRTAVLFLYLATFCLGVSAIFLREATGGETVLLVLQLSGMVALLLLLMFVPRRS